MKRHAAIVRPAVAALNRRVHAVREAALQSLTLELRHREIPAGVVIILHFALPFGSVIAAETARIARL